jgi:hypothetical protein
LIATSIRSHSAICPTGNGIVSGKKIQNATNDFINGRFNGAFARVQAICEARALVHTAGAGIASVNDVLKQRFVPAGHEIRMATVSRGISIGENKRLLALALFPSVLEKRSVPVDFEEKVRHMDVSLGTVRLAFAIITRVYHVFFIISQASLRVVARWEVNVGSKRGGIAITVHIGKADTLSFVVGVGHTSHLAI